ncbi:MAG TPA: iron-sulfur protein [Pseudonocardiaceae bacterium]|nr:iron-sulfur protein [Pseudonocardiaceae bacterium]
MTGVLLHVRHGPPEPAENEAGNRDRWWRCAELLAEPDRLVRWQAMIAGWLTEHYGEAPEATVDGYLVTWYLAAPARLAALMFHTKRRLPALAPKHLVLRLAEQRPRPDGMAVLADEFAVLPDDPEANADWATVVGDEAALAALLRGRFIAHAARFIAAFAPLTRFGRRTLWAAATDALDEALWLTGRHLGNEEAGVANAALVLPDGRSGDSGDSVDSDVLAPLTSASTVRMVRENKSEWTRRRESCCFHYALRAGLGPCDTCPRLSGRGHV